MLIYEYYKRILMRLLPPKKDGKWGCIDFNNRVRIPFIFDEAFYFYDNQATVILNGKESKLTDKARPSPPLPPF